MVPKTNALSIRPPGRLFTLLPATALAFSRFLPDVLHRPDGKGFSLDFHVGADRATRAPTGQNRRAQRKSGFLRRRHQQRRTSSCSIALLAARGSARRTGLSFCCLPLRVEFFPAADPEAKSTSGLQLRLIHGSTLLEAPSPSSFSKEFCSKSSSTCSSGSSSRSSSSTRRSGSSNRSSSGSRLGGHSSPNSRSTRENRFYSEASRAISLQIVGILACMLMCEVEVEVKPLGGEFLL